MSLADLINRKKRATTLPPASAIPAIPAIFTNNQADKKPTIATIATIAIAESKQADTVAPDRMEPVAPTTDNKLSLYCYDGGCHCSQKLPAADCPNGCGACEYLNKPRRNKEAVAAIPSTFEQTGDPVTCPYWYQVCWAVEMYQEQCTRNTACRVYKFLERNT